MYQTDWLEDPVQLMSKEERLLREAAVKQGDLLVLRDKDSVKLLHLLFSKTNFYLANSKGSVEVESLYYSNWAP